MSFQQIMGQQAAKKMLQSSLRRKAISHAYLFSGPAGSGQRKTAMTFAKAIFCTELKMTLVGECLECRKVDHGNHPDLTMLAPDGTTLK